MSPINVLSIPTEASSTNPIPGYRHVATLLKPEWPGIRFDRGVTTANGGSYVASLSTRWWISSPVTVYTRRFPGKARSFSPVDGKTSPTQLRAEIDSISAQSVPGPLDGFGVQANSRGRNLHRSTISGIPCGFPLVEENVNGTFTIRQRAARHARVSGVRATI